jgi:ABC-type polysaccharide/polyol phosphate export permease
MIAAVRECFEYRGLFTALLRRELRVRYGGSVLGYLWTFVGPLCQVAVYTVVFSLIIKTGVSDYPVFRSRRSCRGRGSRSRSWRRRRRSSTAAA